MCLTKMCLNGGSSEGRDGNRTRSVIVRGT